MGLTSLSCLNRAGVYNYWDDSWSSLKLYNRYYSGNFFLKVLIVELLGGSFFNTIFLKNKKTLGYLGKYKLINSYSYKNIYFGKIWYLKFQKWLIIVVYYYDLYSSKFNRNQKKKLSSKHVSNLQTLKYTNMFKQNYKQNFNFNF